MEDICRICASRLEAPVFQSNGSLSITSICEVLAGHISVFYCGSCGHLQTVPLANLDAYYDEQYKILIDSEEEDQLLVLADGTTTYRMEHQAATLLSRVPLVTGARILDYGCAKAGTLKRVLQQQPDLSPWCFDVSEMYLPFWRKFVPEGQWSTHLTPVDWEDCFDVVTSFFALEHVEEPRGFASHVRRLLKRGGVFYGIVPDVLQNTADLVVADHVNHFTRSSLERLLSESGFEDLQIDNQVHPGAWVFTGRAGDSSKSPCGFASEGLAAEVAGICDYWSGFAERVRTFEKGPGNAGPAAVYGSGFYGTYITTCLVDRDRVRCFLDQNPHRQTQHLLGRPILAPDDMPQDIRVIYTGLNPRNAQAILSRVKGIAGRELAVFLP